MNVRTSLVLIVILALIGGYVGLYELRKAPKAENEPPWFYNVTEMDITRIAVTHNGDQQVFIRKDDGWHFQDAQETLVDRQRWGGIVLLVSGPQSRRLLVDETEDLAQYGLDAPQTDISVELLGRRTIDVLLGAVTPDGQAQYAQIKGYPQVFTIHSSWGSVLGKLVTEPPYPTTTPTP